MGHSKWKGAFCRLVFSHEIYKVEPVSERPSYNLHDISIVESRNYVLSNLQSSHAKRTSSSDSMIVTRMNTAGVSISEISFVQNHYRWLSTT